jgi:hypothetical protein
VTQVIEAYNYRIGIDATGVTSGTALTRREINQIKSTFRSLTAPADQASQRIDLLTRAFKQGAVDRVNYNSAVAQLSAKLPANVAATEALAIAQAKAQAIQRSLITEEQQYRAELTATMQAVRDGGLSREQAAEHLRAYKSTLPSAIAEEQRLTAAQREAASIMRANATDSERYRAEVLRVKEAVTLGGLSHEAAKRQLDAFRATLGPAIAHQQQLAAAQATAAQIQRDGMSDAQLYAAEEARVAEAVRLAGLAHVDAQRHLDQYRASLPGAIAAERELAEAKRRSEEAQREVSDVMRAGMTDAERLAEEEARLAKLVRDHGLSEAEATRHLERYRQTLPSVVAADMERTVTLKRADDLTQKYMRSTDRLAQELREINELERAGSIDRRTAGLARSDVRRGAAAARLSELSGVPGLGGIAGQAGQLMAMAGPLAVVAGGVMAVTAAFHAASAAVSAFTAKMQEDAEAVSAVYHAANLLHMRVESLIGLQYAIAQTNGMTGEQSIALIEKLSTNISEAAAGGGKAKQVIEELGLDAKELSLKDPSDAMKVLFDRVSEIQNPVDQARMAIKLFGKQGVDMAEMMREGAAGINAAEDRARELGLIVSGMDSAGINGALDAMMDVEMVITGIVRQFNTGFYPAVTVISNELLTWLQPMTDTRGAGEVIGMTLVGIVGTTIDAIAATVAWHRVMWNIATLDFSEAGEQMDSMTAHLQGSTTNRLAQNWNEAQIAAAKAAHEMEHNAEIERQVLAEAEKEAQVQEHLQKLRDQIKDTAEGTTAADREAQALLAGNVPLLEEERKLRSEIAKQKRDAEVGTALKAAEDELAMMGKMAEAKRQGLDEQTARERINLQVLGAGDKELQRHLQTRREIVAMQQRATAEAKRQADAEKLAQDAKSVKDAQRTQEQVLGEEFRRLQEMRDADLLSEAEFQRAKAEAAANVQIDKQSAAAPAATEFGVESYKRMIAQETAQREAQIEEERRAKLIADAEAVANKLIEEAQRVAAEDAKRLEVQQQITAEMMAQSQLGSPDPVNVPPQPQPEPKSIDRMLASSQAASQQLANQTTIAGRGPEGGLEKLPITQPGMKAELVDVIAVLNRVAIAQEQAVELLRELETAKGV